MNNKNTGILVTVIILATIAICFAVIRSGEQGAKGSNSVATKPAGSDSAGEMAKTEPTEDDPVVAKVDGVNVLRSEVIAFIANFPPQMQQLPPQQLFPVALEQMVIAKIIDQKAAADKTLQNNPEVTKREADARTQILRGVFLEQSVDKELTDSRLKKAYDEFKSTQKTTEEVHARHILVEKEDMAKDIIGKLEKGEKFEDLAKKYSTDPSNKDNGGDLGFFSKDALVKEFADVAFALDKDQVAKTPVKTQFGYHVVQVMDKRTRPIPSFDEVKAELTMQAQRQIANDMIEGWRKKADVVLFDMNGQPLAKDAKPAEPAQNKE